MKDWKIHVAWALSVPVFAYLWGRWTLVHLESERHSPMPVVEDRSINPMQPSMSRASPSPESPPGEVEDEVSFIRRLLRSGKEADRKEGSRLLRRVPDRSKKKELILLALNSPDAELRSTALNDLLDSFKDEAAPYVQAMLKSDPEAYLRRIAAELLGVLGGSGTIEALLSGVHDSERYVQATAAGALSRLGQPGPAEELVPRIAADLSSSDAAVRKEAVKDLWLLRLPSTIPILLHSLRDSDGDVRLQAAVSLGELDSPDLLPSLEALRKDPDPNVVDIVEIAITRYKRHKH